MITVPTDVKYSTRTEQKAKDRMEAGYKALTPPCVFDYLWFCVIKLWSWSDDTLIIPGLCRNVCYLEIHIVYIYMLHCTSILLLRDFID